ncbi:MAG: hypothetical protein PHY08_13300 [Candidatus Cloacimonetes bacterium]|nr:hypothetical protein [Candidatus Cloacimonadota bacterium]
MKRYLFLLIIVNTQWLISIEAKNIEFNGFLDTYHSVNLKNSGSYNSSRTRFRGELLSYSGNSSIFISMNAIENHINPDNTDLSLHEAYLEYFHKNFEVRLGKQLNVWGKADGIRITDVICPIDYSEFITQDFDDIRMPVEMLRLRYKPSTVDVELVWIPLFKKAILPQKDNPWHIKSSYPDTYIFNQEIVPDKTLKNSEYGAKLSFYLQGFDFALSAFSAWDKTPVLKYKTIADTTFIHSEYNRINVIGAELSKPINKFVIRSETAMYLNKHLQSKKNLNKDLLKSMIGLDWYLNSDWTISWQAMSNYIFDYDNNIIEDKNTNLMTFNISAKFFREIITVSNMAYYNLNDKDLYEKISVDYSFTDNLHFSCGADLFIGDKGNYGQYKDMSQVWLKSKYTF